MGAWGAWGLDLRRGVVTVVVGRDTLHIKEGKCM